MTGPEHYRVTEKLRNQAQGHAESGERKEARLTLQFAQVHATLALAAAIGLDMAASEPGDADVAAWGLVAGTRAEAQA